MRFLRVSLFLFSASWACAQVAQSVTISAGTIKGTSCPNAGISAFLNIPYAQPPTGDLRFASPQQYSGEFPSGTYDATSPGPACIQFGSTFLETGPTSEDW
jgi:carboxylesterase type B